MMPRFRRTLIFATILFAFAGVACSDHAPKHKTTTTWRTVGSWSGHGDSQTDSFDIGYNDLRIRWETRDEKPPGAGTFHLTVNSAVSGRELAVIANRKGVGHGLQYVTLDPHWSYLLINSSNLDWFVTVEEQTVLESR